AREVGIHATMVGPVIFDGEIRAALTVGTTDPYRSFDAIERRELRAFADLASTALRAANERRERERRIGRLSALNVLAWQLGAVHDPFEIAHLAFDAAATLVSRDSFSIARYDERGNELEFVINARGDEAGVDEARVPDTRSHSARVAALSRGIAEEMRLSADQVRRIQLGALLHDIGKIGVPDAILNKPGALSADEWVMMRSHSMLGASIVNAVEP